MNARAYVREQQLPPTLRVRLLKVLLPSGDMEVLGTDLLVVSRSDYGPFRAQRIPYLFFTTGENPRYHSPEDTPETPSRPASRARSAAESRGHR